MTTDRRPADPESLRGLLGGAAARFGLDDALATGTLWRRWHDVVGPDLAAHAEPSSLRAGVLRLRADSPVWAHEIGYLAEEIKRRVNEHLGQTVVAEVRVWSAPGETSRPPAATPRARPAEGEKQAEKEGPEDPLQALDKARSAWLARGDRRRLPEGPERR